MSHDKAPPGSSPAEQLRLDLNYDASMAIKKSKGEKLQEKD